MIHGIGIDIVEINRIARIYARYKEHFIHRILHKEEHSDIPSIESHKLAFLASRFAVKEAFVKALGTGFREGISFRDILVTKRSFGIPSLTLYGKAKEYYNSYNIQHAHISLSHEKLYAIAMIVLEH